LASSQDLTSIAFPAISCGVYGYPLRRAAHIALKACHDHATATTITTTTEDGSGDSSTSGGGGGSTIKQIDFVLFSGDVMEAWVKETEALTEKLREVSNNYY